MKELYELAGADENRRFSPYCWRIRMALAHKGLDVECIPWRFTEKDALYIQPLVCQCHSYPPAIRAESSIFICTC
jgi:hypothetical protein